MIELEISKRQLAQIRLLTTRWSMFDRARQHRKWRPLISIKQNPKQWWKFACGRVVEENRRQQSTASKQSMQQRARLMNGYCRAYRRRLRAFLADEMAKQQKLVDPNVRIASATAVNQEDVAYMKQIEHDSEFTYNELQLFRDIVFRKYLKELEQDKKSDVLAAQSATQKVPSAYVLAIALELAELSVNMNYPVNETRLGMAAKRLRFVELRFPTSD
ncbi:hypothetical protein M3Y96_01250300 [Aphelenchoides besseyi]|nr:hypothetical protein M3Y96_01250300 [Aphelenchoides besseyi]